MLLSTRHIYNDLGFLLIFSIISALSGCKSEAESMFSNPDKNAKYEYYQQHPEKMQEKVNVLGFEEFPFSRLLSDAEVQNQPALIAILAKNPPLGMADDVCVRVAVRNGLDLVTDALMAQGKKDPSLSDTIYLLNKEKRGNWQKTLIIVLQKYKFSIDESRIAELAGYDANSRDAELQRKKQRSEDEANLMHYENIGQGDGPDARDIKERLKNNSDK